MSYSVSRCTTMVLAAYPHLRTQVWLLLYDLEVYTGLSD